MNVEYPAPSSIAAHVRRREQERQQQDPADDGRVEHGAPDALRRGDRGALGLLGGVGGGVVARLRVHRQQEPDRQDEEPEAEVAGRASEEPGLVEPLGEDEIRALVVVRHDPEESDDHGDTEEVPTHRDVVHQRQEAVGEDVHHRVAEQDDQEEQELLAQDMAGVTEVDPEDVEPIEPEQDVEEDRGAVSHRGDDPEQADDVEPAGHPAPALAAEVVGPPVGAAGRRIRGGELGHREGHAEDQQAEHRPADRDRDRPPVQPGEAERGETAREDRDDREGDREVGEGAPGSR